MKDREKPEARKAAGDAERIVELTSDMALSKGSDVRIIDLTDAIDGPSEVPAAGPSAPTVPDDITAESESTLYAPSPDQESPEDIELAVDAAFDAVQAPIEEEPASLQAPVSPDDGLIDRLSDVPRMVDQAVESAGSVDSPLETTADDEIEAGDATTSIGTYMDSEMSAFGPDIDSEDILALEEIIDPDQAQAMDAQGVEDDEEIIELVEIVDPAELRAAMADQALADDEIVELTDIVTAVELGFAPAGQASQTSGLLDDDTDWEGLEEELSDISLTTESSDKASAEAAAPPKNESRQQESVIRLSEVLNHGLRKDERLPTEQIEMGAEEELARQHISPEAEDAANSLGLDMENEIGQEGKKLTDEEIEAAVVRILQSKFGKTIEQLIARTVEKAVSREIQNIKRAMLDGDEPSI